MRNFETVLIAQATLILILVCAVLLFVFSDNKKKTKVKKRNIYKTFPLKSLIVISLASFGVSLFINSISSDPLTSAMVFALLVSLIPYSLINAQERMKKEAIFDDVILFCTNTAMLLKQTHNVYASLSKVKEDLSTSLKEDVADLIYCLDNDKEKVRESMEMIEHNYPYSCIKNLDVIIMHMQFEHANINDKLLINYQEDLDLLEKDVKDNKAKRKALRIQYILITVISVVAYWFFVNQLKETFASGFENELYKMAHTAYVFLTIISLFFVDRYFNSTTTKE